MLEKMDEFFERRLDGYDEHMLNEIEGAGEFYRFTAAQLPKCAGCRILDLGCGTGLELEALFALSDGPAVTGIDLSRSMLRALKDKFPAKDMELICGSYFDVPFGTNAYDAAVSVESLHHFTAGEKLALYAKLHASLREGGYFILTDYFAESEESETLYFRELDRLKAEQNISDGGFYHYDTPLTVEHEIDVLRAAGFSSVAILQNWAATYCLRAEK